MGFTTDESIATELETYIVNDGTLYRQRVTPMITNLAKKMAKGTYNRTQAVKLWRYLADAGAKAYNKEFGMGSSGYGPWTPAIRNIVAKELRDYYEEDVEDEAANIKAKRKKNPTRRNPSRKLHSGDYRPRTKPGFYRRTGGDIIYVEGIYTPGDVWSDIQDPDPLSPTDWHVSYVGTLTKADKDGPSAGTQPAGGEMKIYELGAGGWRRMKESDLKPKWKAFFKRAGVKVKANPTRRRTNSGWIQGVDREIEEDHTEGAFTKQARRAGYSNTMEFAHKVMAGWRSGKKTVLNKKTRRQQNITKKTMYRANFAINVQKNPARERSKEISSYYEKCDDALTRKLKSQVLKALKSKSISPGLSNVRTIAQTHAPITFTVRGEPVELKFHVAGVSDDRGTSWDGTKFHRPYFGDISVWTQIRQGAKSVDREAPPTFAQHVKMDVYNSRDGSRDDSYIGTKYLHALPGKVTSKWFTKGRSNPARRKNASKALRKRLPKRIEIVGTRWFQKSYGNTYHVTRIYFNDKLVFESPISYGYGDGYVQTAKDWLVKNRWMPANEPVWRYFRDDKKRQYKAYATDVSRQRDL